MDWKKYFGCTAVFVAGGVLEIFENAKAYKMPGSPSVAWMVVGEKDDDILISPDGIAVSTVKKEFCKIV